MSLRSRPRGRFSETARSSRDARGHPRSRGRHLEAVRRLDRWMVLAVARRCLPDDLAERSAEGPEAREADIEAHVGDAAIRLAQEEHRPLHPTPLEISVRRLPERGAEAPDEVRLGHVGDRGDGADVERLGVGAVHGVARAEKAAVRLLDFPTHGATLRETQLRHGIDPPVAQDALERVAPTHVTTRYVSCVPLVPRLRGAALDLSTHAAGP